MRCIGSIALVAIFHHATLKKARLKMAVTDDSSSEGNVSDFEARMAAWEADQDSQKPSEMDDGIEAMGDK